MAFATLNIDLNANLQGLQAQLAKAAELSNQAAAKIQKSADDAGAALGQAANAANFAPLSKDAAAAAASMDKFKDSSAGAGTEVQSLREKLKGLLSQVQQEANAQFTQLEEKGKAAGLVISVAIGALLAGTVAGTVYTAYKLIKETAGLIAGLFTGEDYKNKYVDDLIAANDRVNQFRHDLDITAASASALNLALSQLDVISKVDFRKVVGGLDSSVRETLALFDALSDEDKAVRKNQNELERLGFEYKDFNGEILKTPELLQNVADRLEEFKKGFDRNQAAKAIGISDPEALIRAARAGDDEVLQQSAERLRAFHLLLGPRTQEAVNQYEDAIRSFKVESQLTADGFKHAVAESIMPQLTGLAEFFKEGFPSAVSGFRGALGGLVAILETFKIAVFTVAQPVIAHFEAIGIAAATMQLVVQSALKFDFSGAQAQAAAGAKAIAERFAEIPSMIKGRLAESTKNLDLIFDKDSGEKVSLNKDIDSGEKYTAPLAAPKKERAAGPGRVDVDLQKKILDQQLKTLELFIGSEKDLLTQRDEFLSLYYQSDEVSIVDYFAFRARALNENLAKTKAAYLEEIADTEKYIRATKGRKDLTGDQAEAKVVEAQTKIIDIRDKLRKVEETASTETLKDWFAQRKAVEQYGDQLRGLEAQLKTLRGDSAGAFEINFDIQNRSLSKKLALDAIANDPAVREAGIAAQTELAQIRSQELARSKLNDLDRQRSTILGDLANQQARINIAVASGASTELQALADASQANRDRIASLSAVVQAYEAIARVSKDPQAIVAADRLRVELERLSSETDLVADKFRALGTSATETFIDKLASGTVTLKDAFKSLFADLNSQLLKLASRNIAESLFGKEGAFKDFGSIISQFFPATAKSGGSGAGAASGVAGVLGGAAGNAANDAAFATLTATVSTSNAALATLTASASAAASALSAVALSGAGGSGSGIASAAANFAAGIIPMAKGNILAAGNIVPFGAGGVVSSPTLFPMANGGTGLMGEAGEEGVLPLRRTRDGRLGVASVGSDRGTKPANVTTNNIYVTSAPGQDRRTASQHGAVIARQLQMAGARNG